MILTAADDLGLDLTSSWLVGDRWVDIAAGRAAGVRTVLIERPGSWNPSSGRAAPSDVVADHCVRTLAAAAAVIDGHGRRP
jgi:D-glycero-D-manno-heptose 1,7-bisphosphate phosphatase